MKIIKYIGGFFAFAILTIVGVGIYFAGQVSSTYPPIETYTFEFSKSEFEKVLEKIDSQKDFELTFTDTTGLDLDSEYSYYFYIFDNRTHDKYLLKYSSDKSFLRGERIQLNLIGLRNEVNNKTIYEPNEGAKEVKIQFEKTLLKTIKN